MYNNGSMAQMMCMNLMRKRQNLHCVNFGNMINLQDVLLDFVQEMRNTQRSLKVLKNFKLAYGHIIANRSNVNLIYRNALLSTIVSCKNGASQSFISRTIGANKYSLRKAIVRRIYLGQAREIIWGGIPRKRQCNVFSE